MSIRLEYILARNKSNLKIFISKNKLTSYDQLVEYCKSRNFIPCLEEEYNNVTKKDVVRNVRKTTTRKTSKTQKSKRGNSRKKQQGPSKLPDSPNKR